MKTDQRTRLRDHSYAQSSVAAEAVASFNTKIQRHHLQRLAIVYVRQSTPRQVLEHRESTELQYGLARRAVSLGWHEDRVLVVDDDQGQSGRSAEHRVGFQRLLAEVGLDHVGLVLGIEMSRLARSNKDWHQLLELCAIFRCLLADQDGVYDPSHYNDRLLLGLKGTMSEAELHIIRGRMMEGKRNKAQRGELFSHMPVGYVRLPHGEVVLDPDEQVQSVVRLIFEKFDELGSGLRVLHYLLGHEIHIPVRPHFGPQSGQLQWRQPNPPMIYGILHHPQYAGAYSYGRSQVNPRRQQPGRPNTGRTLMPMDQWLVLRQDELPAYISWGQYLTNQERLSQNRAGFETLGAPREGASLLSGLVVCGCCGWRMYVAYSDKPHRPRYVCRHQAFGKNLCRNQNLAGRTIDELVSHQVLQALVPASLALSLEAEEQLGREHQRLSEHWQHQRERAHYQTERAHRQFEAVEPENRLVARELEKRWEQALLNERSIQEEYARFQQKQSEPISPEQREQIMALSTDIPTLWDAASTTALDRQMIVRQLIDRIVLRVQEETEFVDVTIHWIGGFVSQHEARRPVGRYESLRDYDRLVARLRELRDQGLTADGIADQLNAEGFHSPRCEHTFNPQAVRQLLSRTGLTRKPTGQAVLDAALRGPHEWWVRDLAVKLAVPFPTLCSWCRKGWVHARRITLAYRRWVVWADDRELRRLQQLRNYRRQAPREAYPQHLTIPNPRNSGD
jgi:DNA invertase Pin-like site-specific DNA recombinase